MHRVRAKRHGAELSSVTRSLSKRWLLRDLEKPKFKD